MSEAISTLDLAWEAVNALGGMLAPNDGPIRHSYHAAINDALAEIEKLGGKDPAPQRLRVVMPGIAEDDARVAEACGIDLSAKKINDGGPAFPLTAGKDFQFAENGMSLRDWFAGQALAGICACPTFDLPTKAGFAQHAYEFADGMIAERAKGGAA
jgi:hypothetical protein